MGYIQDKAKQWLAEASQSGKLEFMFLEGKQTNVALVAAIAACDVADGVIGGLSDLYQSKEPKQLAPPAESLHEMAKRWLIANKTPCYTNMLYEEIANNCKLAEKAIERLCQWASENPPKPVKTYREDFFEKFPNAPKTDSGYPHMDVEHVYSVLGAKRPEYERAQNLYDEWDKPIGYWEA